MEYRSVESQLEYFDSLVKEYLTGDTANLINDQIRLVRDKSKDEKLYLAIVGEFSSGKSTFINALLRQRILKEAVRPTTACATYIEGTADGLRIIASFDKSQFDVTVSDISSLQQYIRETYSIEANDIYQLIELLTSHQRVAGDVTSLHIYIPNSNLPQNIVVIDTPGFNPGDDSAANHFEITHHVVTEVADAALVLMPNSAPFSASIRNFMQNYLYKYLHRCIFLLTRADEIADYDLQEVLSFVKKRMSTDMRLDNAPVFFVSAITMLPVVKMPEFLKEEWSRWQNEFNRLEQYIWSVLSDKNRRTIILSEHLHNLSIELNRVLRHALDKKQMDLERRKKLLEKGKVEHIRDVTSDLVSSVKVEVRKNVRLLEGQITDAINKIKQECAETAWSKFKSYESYKWKNTIMPEITADVEAKNKSVASLVNNMVKAGLQISVNYEIQKMQKKFIEHYSTFPALRYTENDLAISLDEIAIPNMAFSNTMHRINESDDKVFKKDMRSIGMYAGAGAALGTIIPGFGTLFGAGAGAVVGLFKRLSNSQAEITDTVAVSNSIKAEISNYFDALTRAYIDSLEKIQNSVFDSVVAYGDRHVTIYGEKVEDMIKAHEYLTQKTQRSITDLMQKLRVLEDIEETDKCNLATLRTKQ